MRPLSRRHVLQVSLAAALIPGAAWAEMRRPTPRPALSLDRLMERARLGDATLGLAVIDPRDGRLILSRNETLPLPPASTLKTVTALYALDRLGAGHRFVTRAIRAGDTLVLAGGGDPTLDSDRLARLAADVAKAAGGWTPRRLAIWGGALPRIAQIAPAQAVHVAYNPTLSGIMLNFNRVQLGWRCGGQGCDLQMTARGEKVAPRAWRASAAGGAGFVHHADDRGEHWTVPRGVLRGNGAMWLPVRDPEMYAGDAFQTLLRAEGMAVPAVERIDALPDGDVLAQSESLPLRDILADLLRYSTNLTAEAVGLAASGAGNLTASAAAMTAWLGGTGGADFYDHSGLDPRSRIAPLTLARLLARPASQTGLHPLLPLDPLHEVLGREARGNGRDGNPRVEAKTGTLNFVSNLAGYAAADGRDVCFAAMATDAGRHADTSGQSLPAGVIAWTARAKALQRDAILAGLAADQPRAAALPPEI